MENLELYIHIPFCVKKCNYCDFLSACRGAGDQTAYMNQLFKELIVTSPLAAKYTVSSVFIGGGTPSLVDPDLITMLFEVVRKYYALSDDCEITIECNPGTTLRHKFARYRQAGINRLSIGLQSADNEELRTLGRIHTFEEFLKSYQSARMEGFTNINVDLINCFPGETASSWKKTLRNVLMLKPEHVSVYNLIVEEGTPFYRMQEEGTLSLPSEEEMSAIDAVTKDVLSRREYHRYEVSNYAREGYECRHNKGYWTGVPYLGFGIGAASYFEGRRLKNENDFYKYLSAEPASDARESFYQLKTENEKLSEEEKMREFMILGLRLTDGISTIEFFKRFGRRTEDVYGDILEKYTGLGMLERVGYKLRFTERGMDVSNVVLSEF